MKATLARIAVAALLVPAFGAEAIACGTRHFYNNTDQPQRVLFFSGNSTCSVGGGPRSRECIVPPRQVGQLHHEFGGSVMWIDLVQRRYDVGAGAFGVKACYISHTGNTGNIVLNNPTDGDVVTCGPGSYPCR